MCPLDGVDIDAFVDHIPQGTEIPQPVYLLGKQCDHEVNLLFSCESAKAKSDGGVRHIFLYTDSSENVGWLKTGTGTSRPT